MGVRVFVDPSITRVHTLRVRERLETLITEYGSVALVIYLVIFGGTIVAVWAAINAGFEVEGAAAEGGTWLAAWAATKLTQPARIAATLVLTPIVARFVGRKPAPDNVDEFAPRPEMSDAEMETTGVDDGS